MAKSQQKMTSDNLKDIIMEIKTDLIWKPKTWTCPKCGATIGNDYDRCSNCWNGPLPIPEIKEVIRNYYRENPPQTTRNY